MSIHFNSALTACNWLESNLERFRPSLRGGLNSFSHLKPIGELLLALYSFTNSSRWTACGLWTQKVADTLHQWVEGIGENTDWDALHGEIVQNPAIGSALLIFPITSQVTGKPSKWLPSATTILAHTDAGHSYIDIAFARDLAGLGSCHDEAVAHLFAALDQNAGQLPPTSMLYHITHDIFYATRMGRRPMHCAQKDAGRLSECLNQGILHNVKLKNHDLVAELLMCWNWLRFPHNNSYRDGMQLLLSSISEHGFVPGLSQKGADDAANFKRNYHPTLMAFTAIGHSSFTTNPQTHEI